MASFACLNEMTFQLLVGKCKDKKGWVKLSQKAGENFLLTEYVQCDLTSGLQYNVSLMEQYEFIVLAVT